MVDLSRSPTLLPFALHLLRRKPPRFARKKTDGVAEIAPQVRDRKAATQSLWTALRKKAKLFDQLEFELEDTDAAAIEDELAAEMAASRTTAVKAFTREWAQRRAFPDHLPRERAVATEAFERCRPRSSC